MLSLLVAEIFKLYSNQTYVHVGAAGLPCLHIAYEFNFQMSLPHCVVYNYKYKPYTVEHNSISDCIKVYLLHCFVQ
jgi:hypothetical protein